MGLFTNGFNASSKPVLRWPLNIDYSQIDNQVVCVISDTSGLAERPVVIPRVFMPIVARFDGSRSIGDIANEGASVGLTISLVIEIAKLLDKFSFLDSDRTRSMWQQILTDFRDARVRELSHVQRGYPVCCDEIRKQFSDYLSNIDDIKIPDVSSDTIHTIIAPHIDYRRGWKTYGQVYRVMKQIPVPDVILLIGTAHQYSKNPLILTNKAFKTPFGIMPAASTSIKAIAESLERELGYNVFESEILHKSEHSLDLQLPLLGTVYENCKAMPSVIPILVGSFQEYVTSRNDALAITLVESFCNAVAKALEELKNNNLRVMIYCGVDLSHVGAHFGDMSSIKEQGLRELQEYDSYLISQIMSGNASGLYQHIMQVEDRFRVCGFPALYVVLRVLELLNLSINGHCIDYRQSVEQDGNCVVSFFGGVLYQYANT